MTKEADTMVRMRIGQKVAALRKKKGLTQVQLAKLANMDHVSISNIERGKGGCSIDSLEKIAKVLNCRVDLIKNYKQ
jgi:transcriptional regulator with XRE-family HTH domain